MSDEIPDLQRERTRRNPPVTLTLGAFVALVAVVMTLVAGMVALARHFGHAG